MIEQMARAMILAVSPDRDFTMNPYYEVERNYWEHVIRAGLGAMMEPSPMVIDKGIDALDDCVDSDFSSNADGERDYYTSIRSDAAAVTFTAMIQAALDEKEG